MSDLGQFPSQRKGVIWMLDMVMVVEGWNGENGEVEVEVPLRNTWITPGASVILMPHYFYIKQILLTWT